MQAKTRPGWKAWQCSSYDNPTLNKEAIDELASGLPERLRRQEIYAEVIDDAGAVFRKVSELATAVGQESAIEGHLYVGGVDWGRSHDATVFSVVDVTLQHLVYVDRMVSTGYEMQIDRLKALHGRFRLTKILCEANSMGMPLTERLQKDGVPVASFVTTNSTKALIIDQLTMAFEQETIRILPDETLINELLSFEMETLPSGLIRYAAGGSAHDDMVISLALAWHAVSQSATAGRVVHGHVKNRGGGGYYRGGAGGKRKVERS
jgi:phage FluMu gp28-like protein